MDMRRNGQTPSDLIQIDKVLQLEERKGYRDDAATNGVARFVGERTARLLTSAGPDMRHRIQELESLLAEYAELPSPQRQSAVAEARRIVGDLTNRPMQATVAPVVAPRAAKPDTRAPAPARRAPRAAKPTARIGSLADSVRLLPGVGESRAKALAQLGVETVGDLLHLYPRKYIDYGNVQPIASSLFGRLTTIQGTVASIETRRTTTGRELVDAVIADGTGRIHAVWFSPWVARQLVPGTPVSLSGRVEQMRGHLVLQNPEWEILGSETLNTGRIIPVYPLVKNISQKGLRPLVRHALDATRALIVEPLPDNLRADEGLLDMGQALEWIHFPVEGPTGDAAANLRAAQQRVAFDQFLALQLGLLSRKHEWQSQPGTAINVNREALSALNERLPFALTGAQRRSLAEILRDMSQPQPMTRLLQGDVGSGKTIVAALAAYAAILDGYQVALMAPTEILAEQHARGLQRVFEALPDDSRPRIGFLTGSVSGAQRTAVYAAAAAGEIDLLIGTHALIQEDVEFANLGLAIIDEQHRFGVEQRASLRGKGVAPDVLVMTATPIPRTLALTLHGDLDVSTLDEMPPGRQPIETYRVDGRQRADAYRFIRGEIESGRQAFIVFPLVEESETVDARAAVAEHERLSGEVFPDLRLGLLHGRMRPGEKDAVMEAFRDHQIDILVSTSVIEVGIDVPNATVMLIDGADRFGLSQLHQFRGRVGRGAQKSYCILISGDTGSDGNARLQAMVDTQDGFKLAQIDLELRGPGDFLGTRQSGLPELDLAMFADVRDLERARAVAERILEEDPNLESARFALVRARVDAFWKRAIVDVS